MSLWGRVFASLYEPLLGVSERNGLADLRAGLLARADGRTLELGAGTGLNLGHYPAEVTELVLSEPEAPMAARLERRVRARGLPARIVRAGAEELPFADASFDTVVATLVFCTVGGLERSLGEVRRVLAPGGQLLFLEHVRHPDPARARRQERLTPIQRRVACGCHFDRATPAAIVRSGLALHDERQEHFPKAPGILQPLAIGRATR
jgi:ubiquinone/menaquinone biosynthesis C-methylase UbiE